MDIPFWPHKDADNLIHFKKNRRYGKNRSPLLSRQEQRERLREQIEQTPPSRWPQFFLNPLTHLVKLCCWGVLGLAFIFQTTLRIAYSIVLLTAFGLFGVGGLFALLASGKVPKGYWDSLWHGESVLFIIFSVGFLLDIALRTVPDLLGHQLVKKKPFYRPR
jgi:hypothetical protein